MKIWKDKSGKKIDAKEFSTRFKEGITRITPLQMAKTNILGYIIICLGVIIGLIASIMNKQWWLLTILIGSCFITTTSFLGQIQRFIILKNLDNLTKMDDLPLEEVQNENQIT